MTNYNDGKWHGWNGGECPVHPRSVVQIQLADETRLQVEAEMTDCLTGAGNHLWDHSYPIGANDIIAFRVVKEYHEPREVWVNEYPRGIGSAHPCKESADRNASSGRIRCTLFREVV